jgi:hypothetical protein
VVVNERRKWTFASENGVEGDVGCEEAAFDRHLHFAAAPVEVAEEALGKQREVRGGGGGRGGAYPSWSAGAFGHPRTRITALPSKCCEKSHTNAARNGTCGAAPCC